MADVVVEAEVRIVGPHRPAQPTRYEADTLAVAGDLGQLAAHQLDEVVVVGRRPFHDGARSDVHVADAVLDVEEHGVEWTHSFHRTLDCVGLVGALV